MAAHQRLGPRCTICCCRLRDTEMWHGEEKVKTLFKPQNVSKSKVRVDAFSIRCKLFAYYANSCREISLFVDFGQNVWMLLHSPSHNKYPSNINLCRKYIYIIF